MKIERFGIEEKKESKWKIFFKLFFYAIIAIVIYIVVLKVVNLIKHLSVRGDLTATWINLVATILGSIISGLFTYIGVLLTLRYYRKSEANQSRLECIPFLKIELNELYNKKSDLNISKQETIYEVKNKNSKNNIEPKKTLYLKLKISNVGEGFANTLVVKTGENFGGIDYKKLILKNESSELYLKMNIYDESIKDYDIKFAIQYIDCKTNEYIQLYSIKFENQNSNNVDIENGYPKFLSQVHKI